MNEAGSPEPGPGVAIDGFAVVATAVGAAVTAGSADEDEATSAAAEDDEPSELGDVASAETGPELESLGSLFAAQPARPAAAAQLKNVRRDKEDTPTVNHANRTDPRRARPPPN
jgi:hypothetical protein